MLEVRRDDGELCGYVAPQDDRWRSLTTFGAQLGEHSSERDAREHVATVGLQVLADRWTLVATHEGHAAVRAEPFEAIELELGALWV